MITFIKRLFNRKEVERAYERQLEVMAQELAKARKEIKYLKDNAYFQFNRHYLASISLSDIDEESFAGMSENEKRDYVANASLIWENPAFKKEMRKILGSQALFVAAECQNWEQSLIGRGTINGIGLVEDRFKALHSMHLDNIKSRSSEEEGTEGEVIPKL